MDRRVLEILEREFAKFLELSKTDVVMKPELWASKVAQAIDALYPQGDGEGLLRAEDIVAIVKKHDSDLLKMWETEVIEGVLRVDSCMNYVLKAQQSLTLRKYQEEKRTIFKEIREQCKLGGYDYLRIDDIEKRHLEE